VSGGTAGARTQRPKRDQETERTVSVRGRVKGTAASENPRSSKCPEPSEVYQEKEDFTVTFLEKMQDRHVAGSPCGRQGRMT
jgi:hypothetical protein